MDTPTLFGLLAASAIVVFYARHRRTARVFAIAASVCAAIAAYSFAMGGWPFGLIELAWTAMLTRRWWTLRNAGLDVAQRGVAKPRTSC